MKPGQQEREFFIRRVSKLLSLAMDSVKKDIGYVDSTEVARRVARNLWAQTDSTTSASRADWVKYIRATTGENQIEFAKRLGTNQVTVSRWESGKVNPSPAYCKLLRTIAREHWIYENEPP